MIFGLFRRPGKIARLAAGEDALVQGKLVLEKELTIPGTDIRCAFYWMLTDVWDRMTPGKGRKMWIPQHSSQGTKGFFIDDGTGRIWICDEIAKTELHGGWNAGGPVGRKGTSRFTTRYLKPGDIVRAQGLVTAAKGSEPGGSLVLRPGKDKPLVLTQKKKASPAPA